MAFHSFGCYDGGPQHGLFVIDGAGTVRARYVGDVPFADPQEVCERVRRLPAANEGGPRRLALPMTFPMLLR